MSARNKAKPKLTLKKEVIEVSAEDHAKLKRAIAKPPKPNKALKKLMTDPPAVLNVDQKKAAEQFLESMPIEAIPIPGRFIPILERHFGEPHVMPRCYRGVLNACRFNPETGEIQLILTREATDEDFMHEYGHYLAFTYAPDMVTEVSESINETFANLMVSKVLHKKFIPNIGKFVRDFYLRMVDYE